MQSWIRESSCGGGCSLHARAQRAYQQTPALWHRPRCQAGHTCLKLHAAMPDRPMFLGQDEYSFSLTQYMVVLEKPIGLTLAPDPTTGLVYVQHIEQDMAAADSKLILVGDRLLSCSAVFGDEMWHASDLQRTRWAINNRPGKVKLVLERGDGRVPPWYFQGREGLATWEVPELQLPIQFITPVGGELADRVAGGVGRIMTVSFSRCMDPVAVPEQSRHQGLSRGLLARRVRAEELAQQLSDTVSSPDVDLSSPVSRLLAGKDGGRFQVGVSGTPLQPGSTTNVLPFRRHTSSGSGSSTPNPSNNSSSSSQPSPNSNSSGTAAGSNSSSSIPNPNNIQGNSNNNSNSDGGAAAVIGASAVGGDSINSSSSSNGGISKQPGGGPSPAAAAAAAAAWGGSAAGAAAGAPIPVAKKVVQVLPWLLVSNARLNALDLTRLATNRSLECLSEMRLIVNQEGLLCPVSCQPPPFSLPAAPVPPTLSPSTTPAPAPENPPPMPVQQQQQEQQQQDQEQQQQQQSSAGLSADLIGIAGPDVGFASAAATAAAVAAAARAGDSSSSSCEPSQVTLQAHAILHCMADLHRLAVRRRWTPKLGTRWQKHAPSPGPSTAGGLASGFAAAGLPVPPGLRAAGQGLAPGVSQAFGQFSGSSTVVGAAHSGSSGIQQSHSQLLLSCDEGNWGLTGVLLVSWLHWHCGLSEVAAIEGVSKALGVTLETAVLSEVRRLLVVRAKERFSRLMLTWPYGGLSAEVSGDLVGGWTERVAMRRCLNPEGCLGASKGHFYLELKGLHPGRYHYKFIIDNTWDIDPAAPKTLDSQGNWNNVLDVSPPPRIHSPEEEAHFAALHATYTAYERKLRPVGSLF